jgi:uncharacterized membrane protein YidH (DUF202 family)
MNAPWDPGLQNERTGLAWQRTMLSVLTCSLLLARLLAGVSLTLAVITGLVALACTAGLGWVAVLRFRRHSTDLHAGRPVGGGLPQLLAMLAIIATAGGALAYVIAV